MHLSSFCNNIYRFASLAMRILVFLSSAITAQLLGGAFKPSNIKINSHQIINLTNYKASILKIRIHLKKEKKGNFNTWHCWHFANTRFLDIVD